MAWTKDKISHEMIKYTSDTIDASGANSSDAIDIFGMTSLSVHVAHASHDDTSTWELQSRNDGSNWDTVSGTSTTTNGTSGSDAVDVTGINADELRVTVTEVDNNASATLTPVLVAARNR